MNYSTDLDLSKLFKNLVNETDQNKVIEHPELVEFSKKTVKIGTSIYQVRNITGFEVGKIPKRKLPILLVIGLIICGCGLWILNKNSASFVFIWIAVWIIWMYFSQSQKYAFILEMNSGVNTYLVSKDPNFLGRIVSATYRLIEGDVDGITVTWHDRSIKVHEMKGVINAGDNTQIDYDS